MDNQKKAINDLTSAMEDVFKKMTLSTRKNIWQKIQSKKGKQAINKIISDPRRNVNSLFEPLTFKEWISSSDHKN